MQKQGRPEEKKGVEVVYVPGGPSPYGSMQRNAPGKLGMVVCLCICPPKFALFDAIYFVLLLIFLLMLDFIPEPFI